MVGRPIVSAMLTGAALLTALLVAGTLGFLIVAGFSLGDALYMTVITISTVGYGEVQPLNDGGRVVASLLIVAGVGTFFYVLTTMVQLATGDALRRAFEERRMRGKLSELSGHYVLCGFGRVGQKTAAQFRAHGAELVVIDRAPEAVNLARAHGHLVVEGDATDDDVLRMARVPQARGLVAASDGDAQNTYITLSARALNPDLVIVARAGHPDAEAKLLRAGANHVVSPYEISGRHMALRSLQPLMVDFMDMVVTAREGERILAELEVQTASPLTGRTLRDVCHGADLVVLGLRRPDGALTVGPSAQTTLAAGDYLILLGAPDDIERIAPANGAIAAAN